MTLDEIRDAIAAKLGWTRCVDGGWRYRRDRDAYVWVDKHPVPASLDWVSENWPHNRAMRMDYQADLGWIAVAWESTSREINSRYRRTELHARMALLLAVLEAEGTR